jgi:integrase
MSVKKETTHIITEGELVLYRRERSSIWQCRYRVAGVWQRASTKERKLKDAKEVAKELRLTAEIRKRDNLPVITRKFRDVAKLAIQRMEQKIANGEGKVSFKDYIRIINDYLIPILGNRLITNIDHTALVHLDAERTILMERAPSNSTLLSQNAALNVVFDEGILRNFLTELNRPKLEAKGKKSSRHPAFELNELQAVLNNFEEWVTRGRNDHSKEMRQIMRDYAEMLIDTGARPGKELMNLKWKQINFSMNPKLIHTGQIEMQDDGTQEEIVLANLNRIVEMTVTGKTGTRQIIGRQPTVKVLERIARRVYNVRNSISDPFKDVVTPNNDDFVLRTKLKKQDVSPAFQHMLERYLEEHNLLYDPKTEQNRVFYSFRHTYATLALTHDKVPIHTLAKQMGTSVLMIERHYSHLKVIQAVEQLSGAETRRKIAATSTVEDIYKSSQEKKKAELAVEKTATKKPPAKTAVAKKSSKAK